MIKRLLLSSALLSAVATSTAFAQWPTTGGQNGIFGVNIWVWVIIVVVIVAVAFFVLKGKKK